MFAVVNLGGRQRLVRPNTKFRIDKIEIEQGEAYEFKEVLVLQDAEGTISVGQPLVDKGLVVASVVRHAKDKKIRIFKKKRRKKYRRSKGHRQDFTELLVRFIGIGEAPEEAYEKLPEVEGYDKDDDDDDDEYEEDEYEDDNGSEEPESPEFDDDDEEEYAENDDDDSDEYEDDEDGEDEDEDGEDDEEPENEE